jgi:hypothetical protein
MPCNHFMNYITPRNRFQTIYKSSRAANGQLMCNKNQKTDFSYMNSIK